MLFLAEEEVKLRLLEKASELERRGRKYKPFALNEPWSSRWVALPVSSLFPIERREEWLGDLYELNREMVHKMYPLWLVHLINLGRTAILIMSAVQIKILDLIPLGVKQNK